MNIKKFLVGTAAGAIMLGTMAIPAFAAGGFDQYGYNDKARIFVGTGSSWCQGKLGWTEAVCDAYMGDYANDHLVMKWNAAWDACVVGTEPECAGAWTDNEWNGNVPGGSQTGVWHYKIVWSAVCAAGGTLTDGGYCIWGSYEMLMSQGADAGPVFWDAHATPNGYGVTP